MATISLSHIGIETEIDVVERSSFLDRNNLHIGDIRNGIQIDEEYYSNQVEFKSHGEIGIDGIANFRNGVIEYLLENSNNVPYARSPSFVGTHIHMFLKDGQAPLSTPLGKAKCYLTAMPYYEVTKFIKEWIELMPVNKSGNIEFNRFKNPFKEKPLRREMERVLTSNNVSKYFDHSLMNGRLKLNLREFGMGYAYSGIGNDRPKYQPVIWSLARDDGKPLSLEVRLLPNAWFLLSKEEDISKFITKMVARTGRAKELKARTLEFAETISKESIYKMHRALVYAYMNLFHYGNDGRRKLAVDALEESLEIFREGEKLIAKATSSSPPDVTGTSFEIAFSEPVTDTLVFVGEAGESDDDGLPDNDGDSQPERDEDIVYTSTVTPSQIWGPTGARHVTPSTNNRHMSSADMEAAINRLNSAQGPSIYSEYIAQIREGLVIDDTVRTEPFSNGMNPVSVTFENRPTMTREEAIAHMEAHNNTPQAPF